MRLAVLILPLVWANMTVAADDAQDSQRPVDLSGPWMSTFGPVTIKQEGTSITGAFIEGTERVRKAYIRGKTVPETSQMGNVVQ